MTQRDAGRTWAALAAAAQVLVAARPAAALDGPLVDISTLDSS